MRPHRVAAVAVLALLAAALAGGLRPEAAEGVEADGQTIAVNGTGTVLVVPDRAEVSFGVESRGRTAREALAANAIEMRRLLDALHEAGVDRRNLRTEHLSLMPVYDAKGREIVAYVASNTAGAEVDLAGAGAVIDAAVEAGANHVYGPTMSRADESDLYRRALRAALADARRKAEALAAAGAFSVGRIVSVAETGVAPPPEPVAVAERVTLAADATPIEPGTSELVATVTVTYAFS
jgi:uncharacterized protein YggE